MEELVRERINEVLSLFKTNPNQLSKGNSALQVRLSRQLSQGAAITCKTISFILETYPDISAEWLMRGKGEMYLSEKREDSTGYGTYREMHDRIVALEAENKVLRELAGLQGEKSEREKTA